MFTMVSKVDKTTGNYETTFIYSLDVGFSGVSGSVDSAEVSIFIPEYFDLYVGDVEEPVKEYREEEVPTGGRNLIFDFGQIEELGIAVRLGFALVFNQTAVSGDSFEMLSQLYINEELNTEYTNEAITLDATTRFELSRELILPQMNPASGSAVYYKVTLENFGDVGGEVQKINIDIEGNDNYVLDPDWEVIGYDNSTKFADTRLDGRLGVVNENVLTFYLEQYSGQKYEFIYRAIVQNDSGTEVVTYANWSIDDVEKETDIEKVTLADETALTSVAIYAPRYTLNDEYISYEISMTNTGNMMLTDFDLIGDLSKKVNYYQFETGVFHFGEINVELDKQYSIKYTTDNGTEDYFGPFNTNTNSTVDLQFLLDLGDNIDTLTWELGDVGIGVTTKQVPTIDGTVKNAEEASRKCNKYN